MKWTTDFATRRKVTRKQPYASIVNLSGSVAVFLSTEVTSQVPMQKYAKVGYDSETKKLVIIPSLEKEGTLNVLLSNQNRRGYIIITSFLRLCGETEMPEKGHYRVEIEDGKNIHVFLNEKV